MFRPRYTIDEVKTLIDRLEAQNKSAGHWRFVLKQMRNQQLVDEVKAAKRRARETRAA